MAVVAWTVNGRRAALLIALSALVDLEARLSSV
jgi:hypothetical protein